MKKSRRAFFSFIGRLSLLVILASLGGIKWKRVGENLAEEDIVIVNGWVLKKSDLV